MYEVAVQRRFEASHQLVGRDFGPEGLPHSHPYLLEVVLSGPHLDGEGFLFDIAALDRALDALVKRYEGRWLNDLEGFVGLNPSLERFARDVAQRLRPTLESPSLRAYTVRLWESPTAWASGRTTSAANDRRPRRASCWAISPSSRSRSKVRTASSRAACGEPSSARVSACASTSSRGRPARSPIRSPPSISRA